MSQEQAILAYLRTGHLITPIGALQKFNTFRLAARIADLRRAGHVIRTETIKTRSGKRVAAYLLVEAA